MKAIFSSVGTQGDVIPVLCIAQAFHNAGGECLCVVNPADSKLAQSYRLPYVSSGIRFDMDKFIGKHPELCTAVGTARFIEQAVLPQMKEQYLTVANLLTEFKPDIVVGHFLCFGAEWAAHDASIRYASVMLAPITTFSSADPSCSIWEFRYLPRMLRAALIRLGKVLFARDMNHKLALLAKDIPADFHKKSYFVSKSNSALQLALWSSAFRGAAVDDSKNIKICGFVRHPATGQKISEKANHFIRKYGSPVVVGFGTSARNIALNTYKLIASACVQLNIPCLLIGIDNPELERDSDLVCTSSFEPFDEIFSHASLLIHHGGASTTSAAFRSKKPALIIPFMFDQFDNAHRCCDLGVAKVLNSKNITVKKLVDALRSIRNDQQIGTRSLAFGENIISEPDGARVAATILSDFIKSSALKVSLARV